jgi:uncharacterized membrane protein
MDQNTPPQSSTDAPSPGGQPAGGMPPASNYPRPAGGGMVSQDEKTQATVMWVLAIFASLISPLIFFLIAKDKPFVYRHAAMGLALCIVNAIIMIVLFVTIVGALLVPLVAIWNLVICIMGAMAANRGEEYTPPLVGGLAKSIFKVS